MLKILKKAEPTEEKPPERLPEGGDRFLWTELPPTAKKVEYAEVLKFARKEPLDKR